MILTRLTKAVREQSWLAVIIEFVIVIAGVVMGFQITAWNEARAEHQREALIIARLEADFIEIETRTAQAVEVLEARTEAARALAIIARGDPSEVTREEFRNALNSAIGTLVPNGRSATYMELLASGEMRLIRSERLRDALVRFDDQVRRQELAYGTLAELVFGNAGILLSTQALDLAMGETPADRYASEMAAIRASPELLTAAQLMVTVNAINHRWHEGTLVRAREVLDELGTDEPRQ